VKHLDRHRLVFLFVVIAVFLSETPRQTSFSVFVCYVIAVFLSETPRQTSFSVLVC
jgi:hypothetical protein